MQHPIYDPLDPTDPREIGGYRIVAKLGAGGMGRVYLGTTRSGRRLAIKVVRPDFADDPDFRRRFQQEVAAAQRVQNLYTAPVIDADPTGPMPWLATAHVPGPSLAQAVVDDGPLPAASVRSLGAGVAEALQAIHKAEVIHRDLKPSNVLLASDGPRVIDFGIARAADATPLTRTGGTVGSPQFMAPEQVHGSPSTPALDVFAFGSLVFFAATGRSPFGEGPAQAVMFRIANNEPVLDGCPPELLDLVRRCLAKSPEDRPTVTALLTELTETPGTGWLPEAVTTRLQAYDTIPAVDFGPPLAPPMGPVRPITGETPVTAAGTATPNYQPGQTPPPGTYPPGQTPPPGMYPQSGQTPPPGTYPSFGGTPPPGTYPSQFPAPLGQAPARKSRKGPIVAAVVTVGVVVVAVPTAMALMSSGGNGSTASNGSSPTGAAPIATLPTNGLESPSASVTAPTLSPSGSVTPGASTSVTGGPGGLQPEGTELANVKGIQLTAGYRINFLEDPQHPRSDISDPDLSYHSGVGSILGNQIAIVQPGQPGTYRGCVDNTRYSASVPSTLIHKGLVFCVTTSHGIVALVRVTGLETTPARYVSLDLVAWQGVVPTN